MSTFFLSVTRRRMFATLPLLIFLPALCLGRYVDRLYQPYVDTSGIYPGGLTYRSVHGWGVSSAGLFRPYDC